MNKSGHCHCGNVKFEVSGEPLAMKQCHCNACKRLTGTGHNVQAFFNVSDIKIVGETSTHESTSDAGNIRNRHFCPNCGSRLFAYNSAMPNAVGIPAGSFDDSSWFKPDVILYNSNRPDWDTIDENIKTHDLM